MICPFHKALSPIAGIGLFASRYFPCGTVLLKVSDNKGNFTDMGKYINHAPLNGCLALGTGANIDIYSTKDGCYAVAAVPIMPGRELLRRA